MRFCIALFFIFSVSYAFDGMPDTRPVVDLFFDIDGNFAWDLPEKTDVSNSRLHQLSYVAYPGQAVPTETLIEPDFMPFLESLKADKKIRWRISFRTGNDMDQKKALLENLRYHDGKSVWEESEGRLLVTDSSAVVKKSSDFSKRFPMNPPIGAHRLMFDDQEGWGPDDLFHMIHTKTRTGKAGLLGNSPDTEGQNFDRNRWTLLAGLLSEYSETFPQKDPGSFLMERVAGDDFLFELAHQGEYLKKWQERGEKLLNPTAQHGCLKYFHKRKQKTPEGP